MTKRVLLAIVTALVAVLGLAALVPPAAAAATTRIMPFGDSITGSNGCWRALLWQHLQRTGHTDVDFVGTLRNTYCQGSFDGDNEGHGGFLATGIADNNQLPGWLAQARPDIVLMMLGTNDVWSHKPTATILAAYSKLLGQMRAANPGVKVIVAQILPMNPSGCADCAQGVVNLNNAIPSWAAANSTGQSPVTVVDQWSGFSTAQDTVDGVHPNDTSGIQKVESRWFPALEAALSPTTTPPATSTPPSPPASPSGPVTGDCAITYTRTNQWSGGAQIDVTVRGAAAVNGWTLTWNQPTGQQITQSWNATVTQTGGTVRATNTAWNTRLPASFGFILNTGGNTGTPTAFTLNGSACRST